jgi:hypothetical protein
MIISTALGATDTAQPGDMSDLELYAALEDWQLQRSINGRGRNEAAAHFRSVAKPIIAALKRELRRRKLPMECPDWLIAAEQNLADAQDERETRDSVRNGGAL